MFNTKLPIIGYLDHKKFGIWFQKMFKTWLPFQVFRKNMNSALFALLKVSMACPIPVSSCFVAPQILDSG